MEGGPAARAGTSGQELVQLGGEVLAYSVGALACSAAMLAYGPFECNKVWQWIGYDISLPHLLAAGLEVLPRTSMMLLLLHTYLHTSREDRGTQAFYALAPESTAPRILMVLSPRLAICWRLLSYAWRANECLAEAALGCAFMVHSSIAQRRAMQRLEAEQRRLARATARALSGGRENVHQVCSKLMQLAAASLGFLDLAETAQFSLITFLFDYFLSNKIVSLISNVCPCLLPRGFETKLYANCIALFELCAARPSLELSIAASRLLKRCFLRFLRRYDSAPVWQRTRRHLSRRSSNTQPSDSSGIANDNMTSAAGSAQDRPSIGAPAQDPASLRSVDLEPRSYAVLFGDDAEEDEDDAVAVSDSDEGPISTAELIQKLKEWAIKAAGRSDTPAGGWPEQVELPGGIDPPIEQFICPITRAPMRQPAVAVPSGNSYEKEALKMWVSKHGTEPLTREPLDVEHIIPNRALHRQIADWAKTVRQRKQRARGGVLTWLDALYLIACEDDKDAEDKDPDYVPQYDDAEMKSDESEEEG